MIGIVGIVMVFVMVFGGFALAGGNIGVILQALPHEMITIGGASVGAFLLANDFRTVKQTGRDVMKVFRGPKWKPADYRDLLGMLFDLIRVGRTNSVALEEHIELPDRILDLRAISQDPERPRTGRHDLRHDARGLDEL